MGTLPITIKQKARTALTPPSPLVLPASQPMSADHALDLSPSSLKQGLIELADMVKHSMNASARALAQGDSRIARDVNADDMLINRFRFELEEHCYRVLRSQSLTERELRHVVGAL